MLMQGRSMPLR